MGTWHRANCLFSTLQLLLYFSYFYIMLFLSFGCYLVLILIAFAPNWYCFCPLILTDLTLIYCFWPYFALFELILIVLPYYLLYRYYILLLYLISHFFYAVFINGISPVFPNSLTNTNINKIKPIYLKYTSNLK